MDVEWHIRRVVAVIATMAATVAGGLLAPLGVGSAGASGSGWTSSVLTVPGSSGQATLTSVSCTSSSHCVAVGSYSSLTNNKTVENPMAETLSGGTWAEAVLPRPSGSTDDALTGVSCPTSTTCVAVGNDSQYTVPTGTAEHGFAEVWSGKTNTWTVQGPFALPGSSFIGTLTGISCTASNACVAVGSSEGSPTYTGIAYTYNGSTWVLTDGNLPTSRFLGLRGVACASTTSCEAVGYTGTGSSNDLLVEHLTGSAWSASHPADPASSTTATFTAVQCPGAIPGSCVATGDYRTSTGTNGFVENLSGTGTATTLAANGNPTTLLGISCTSTTACVGSGLGYKTIATTYVQEALVETYQSAGWNPTTGFQPSGTGSPRLQSVSCASVGHCVAVGSVTGESKVLVASEAQTTATTAASFSVQAPTTVTAGTPFTVSLTAKTASNSTATSYSGTKAVTFGGPATSPNGTAPSYPATVHFATGVGNASVTLTDAQTTALTATQGTITGTSGTITVQPGTAASFIVAAPASATAGTAFTFSVTAKDGDGNTATGYPGTVHFTSSDPKATLPADSGLSGGTGTFTVTLRTAGAQTVSATDTTNPTLKGTSTSITVAPAPAVALVVTTPSTATAGTGFTFTVTAKDAYGNIATTDSDTLRFSSTDPKATLPAPGTLSGGTGTFPATLHTAGPQTITVTDHTNPLLSTTSSTITVDPGAATHFSVTAPFTATAGTAFPATLTAEDATGNVATSYSGTKAVTFGGPATSPNGTAPSYPATVHFATGVGNASVTLTDAQTTALTATQGTITGTSGTITVAPGATTTFTVGAPAKASAGTAFTVTLAATDAEGNPTPTYSGTKDVTFSGPTASPGGTAPTYPATVHFATGVGKATVTLTDAQTTTLTATQKTVSGTSGSITVSAVLPARPAAPTATRGNGAATVTWSAPTTGGDRITSYTVTSTPTGKSCTLTTFSGPLTCAVTGLQNGTPYTFTVTAHTTAGTSPTSTPSNSVTPLGKPGAPTGVHAQVSGKSVVVTWTAPATTGGASSLTYEVLRATTTGGEQTIATGVTSTTFADTTVTLRTTYLYRVVAVNAAEHSTPSGAASVTFTATAAAGGPGYFLVGADGGVFAFGSAPFAGSESGQHLNAPIVGMARDPSTGGYWLVAGDGGVFSFDAPFYGSMGGKPLNAPVVGMAAAPTGRGYWLVAADGGVFSFGNVPFDGSMGGKSLNAPMVGITAAPTGKGYWLVAADGGVFTFGNVPFYGSMGGKPLNAPVVGIATDPNGHGYWLVAGDGGVFSFGPVPFYGSEGGKPLNAPVVGMAPDLTGDGYWLVAADGGVFTFGTVPFEGSEGGQPLNAPAVDMTVG